MHCFPERARAINLRRLIQFFRSPRKPTSAGILAVMCGRYALVKSAGELIEEFEITTNRIPASLPADWNIAPTREIYVIRNLRDNEDKNARELATHSWGMIAPWS